MDIHKPKPIHGWRDLIKEIGIIVIGVSIALAGEQAVEKWREHRQYLADRQAVRTELALGITNTSRRNGFSSCITRRLNDIAALLDHAEANQTFAAPHWIGSPNSFVVRTTSEADLGRSDLFPSNEQQIYGLPYVWLHSLDRFQDQERLAWSHLQPLEGRTSLTPAMIAEMRAAIGEARMANERYRYTLNFLRLFARRYGLHLGAANEWISLRPTTWPICLPMSTPRAEGERLMFEYVETRK
jgi:hypothetical protein